MEADLHLILVRHGRPQIGRDAVGDDLAGDPPLSPEGRAQAERTAARLALEPVDRIVSSGMHRAHDTARPLADRLGLPIRIERLIGEVDRVTGRYASIESVRARGRDEWRRFLDAPLAYFGVDAAVFRTEVLDGFRRATEGGGRIALFTHGFPINILLSHALGLASEARFVPGYGSITRLAGRHLDALTVVSVNETAHMPVAAHPAAETLT